jgi:hypothetical protein
MDMLRGTEKNLKQIAGAIGVVSSSIFYPNQK